MQVPQRPLLAAAVPTVLHPQSTASSVTSLTFTHSGFVHLFFSMTSPPSNKKASVLMPADGHPLSCSEQRPLGTGLALCTSAVHLLVLTTECNRRGAVGLAFVVSMVILARNKNRLRRHEPYFCALRLWPFLLFFAFHSHPPLLQRGETQNYSVLF